MLDRENLIIVNQSTTDSDVDSLIRWRFAQTKSESYSDYHVVGSLFIRLPLDCLTFEHIAYNANFFPSLSQARKNGWSGPVPREINSKTFGQKRRAIVWWMNLDANSRVDLNVDFDPSVITITMETNREGAKHNADCRCNRCADALEQLINDE